MILIKVQPVLRKLIEWAGKPFLAANIDASEDQYLKDRIQPYILYKVDNEKVAIIGLTTEEIQKYGEQKTGKIKLKNLQESVIAAVKNARENGAATFVILSHLGYEEDKKLANSAFIQDLDISLVILGNHTHTTTGNILDEYSFGPSKGEYPTVVELAHGHKALITTVPHNAQAVAYLEVEYDAAGHIINYSKDSLIVVDEKIPVDEKVTALIQDYKEKLPPHLNKIYGETTIAYSGLDGQPPFAKPIEDYIRQTESPIGNLAADAFHWQAKKLDENIDFSLIHAGGIRTDWPQDEITGWEIEQLHPFKHHIVVLELTGA